MDARPFSEVFAYNRWANDRMMDAAAGLRIEQFTQEIGGSMPSIQATLTHMVWAEQLWLGRWKEGASREALRPEDFPTVDALREHWTPVQDAIDEFVAWLTDASLEEIRPYANFEGEVQEYALWRQLVHLLNHSSYHRGQVTDKLRQIGATPPQPDFLRYRDQLD